MTFVADEGVDLEVVKQLRSEGYEVVYVAEDCATAPDLEVLDHANKLKSVLLTQDKDFGELVFREGRAFYGVLLMRLGDLGTLDKAVLVGEMIRLHGEKLPGNFSVLTTRSLRVRRRDL